MPQDDVCLGNGSDSSSSSDSNSAQATVHTHFASCCCCCYFFLVHSACSSLGCKKCIWAKTTRQTCRLVGSRDGEWGSRRSLAWLAVELGVPCTLPPLGPAPPPQSLSALLHLSLPQAQSASPSRHLGIASWSRLVGRYVCLRQLQITLSDTIVLGLGEA